MLYSWRQLETSDDEHKSFGVSFFPSKFKSRELTGTKRDQKSEKER